MAATFDDVPAVGVDEYSNLTPAQRRLKEMRDKIKKGRDANHAEVVDESLKKQDPEYAAKKLKEDMLKLKKKVVTGEEGGPAADEESGEPSAKRRKDSDIQAAKYFRDTVDAAEWRAKRAEKKVNITGYDIHNVEARYHTYDKQVDKIEVDLEAYARLKEKVGDGVTNTMTTLSYGQNSETTFEQREKLKEQMAEAKAKKEKAFRKRGRSENDDVTFISSSNEQFNRKAARAYNQYTVEIKANLERGTAL